MLRDHVAFYAGPLDRCSIDGERVDEPWLADGQTTSNLDPQTIPEGHVFVMGDNRDDSRDSRFFGPVPHDDVVQIVVGRWWPLGEVGGL